MFENIEYTPFQCLCELIDNCIDAFTDFEDSENIQSSIVINIPKEKDRKNLPITIRDNGGGMQIEQLNKSVKAGYSGNESMDKMGLYGMGLNIATARLGQVTEIVTYRKNEDFKLKVRIDINELNRTNDFNVPYEKIPKEIDEKGLHGTEISIFKIREGFLEKLRKGANISRKLGRTYGRVLRNNKIDLIYMGIPTTPYQHCIWDKTRKGKKGAEVKIDIDQYIGSQKYCVSCFRWLNEKQLFCPSCEDNKNLIDRERRVKGWIGLQRYFDEKDYGFDLIRNGRVIRSFDKSLFYWIADHIDSDEGEIEYVIDGTHGGRFVGELEIDFVQVDFQKKSFITTSKEWKQFSRTVRGDGPIRPLIAKRYNLQENNSPLAKLFNAFRTDKVGIENFVPRRPNSSGGIYQKDGLIKDLKLKFFENETDYQDDQKWYELLEKGEKKSGNSSNQGGGGNNDGLSQEDENVGGDPFEEDDNSTNENVGSDNEKKGNKDDELFDLDKELSSTYFIEPFNETKLQVDVLKAKKGINTKGFHIKSRNRYVEFKYWPDSKIFKESFLNVRDLLINELAYLLFNITDITLEEFPISLFERSLRNKYFPELHPEINYLRDEIENLTHEIQLHMRNSIKEISNYSSDNLSEKLKSEIFERMQHGELIDEKDMKEALDKGEFMNFARLKQLYEVFTIYPETLFDGQFFIKLPSDENLARELIQDSKMVFNDILWWEKNGIPNTSIIWKGRSRRVIGSLEILRGWRKK